MSLDKNGLKQNLKEVYENTREATGSDSDAFNAFLDAICDAFEKFVKSGKGRYLGGLQAGPYSVTAMSADQTITEII